MKQDAEDRKDLKAQVEESAINGECKLVLDSFCDAKNREQEYEAILKTLPPFVKPFLAVVIQGPCFSGGTYRRVPVSLIESCRIYAEGHDGNRRMKYEKMIDVIISKMKLKSNRPHKHTLRSIELYFTFSILPGDPNPKSIQQILESRKKEFPLHRIGLTKLASDEELYTCEGDY
jgi:hypothetical protein